MGRGGGRLHALHKVLQALAHVEHAPASGDWTMTRLMASRGAK